MTHTLEDYHTREQGRNKLHVNISYIKSPSLKQGARIWVMNGAGDIIDVLNNKQGIRQG